MAMVTEGVTNSTFSKNVTGKGRWGLRSKVGVTSEIGGVKTVGVVAAVKTGAANVGVVADSLAPSLDSLTTSLPFPGFAKAIGLVQGSFMVILLKSNFSGLSWALFWAWTGSLTKVPESSQMKRSCSKEAIPSTL